jgi:hypothetical protein
MSAAAAGTLSLWWRVETYTHSVQDAAARGQLGHGDLERMEFPRLVESLVGVPIVAVAGGSVHSLALRIQLWRACGALGGGDYVSSSDPQLVTTLIDQRVTVTEIAAGGHSSSSRNRAAGLLYTTWGSNLNLTLGHAYGDEPPPARVCTPTLLMIPEWSGGDVPELVPLDLLRQPHSGHWSGGRTLITTSACDVSTLR